MGAGEHRRLLELTLPSMRAYARRHGWDVAATTKSACPARPAAWSKIPMIRQLLTSHEIVLWIDCDAIVLDQRPDIREVMRSDRDVYLVEHRYEGLRVPNAGVMMFRRSDAAFDLLDAIWQSSDLIDHPWWENAALHPPPRLRTAQPAPTGPVRPSPYRDVVEFIDRRWNSVHKDTVEHPVIPRLRGNARTDGAWPGYGETSRPLIRGRARAGDAHASPRGAPSRSGTIAARTAEGGRMTSRPALLPDTPGTREQAPR